MTKCRIVKRHSVSGIVSFVVQTKGWWMWYDAHVRDTLVDATALVQYYDGSQERDEVVWTNE
jgi:hypothetical protein